MVIPARNEAQTIGSIIESIRTELIEKHPLVDEIVVIDGESVDATISVAKAAGATVFRGSEIRLPVFAPPGKGSALYKSLSVCSGTHLVFLDADIKNFTPRFVYGLVGPLLCDPALDFVKACYSRPLEIDGLKIPAGGGRVTEIMVRPLISLFTPELSSFLQPLSGEYAIRRSVAIDLPFSSGYGVELGLLLDLFKQKGLDGCAQVDMGERVHRNRPLEDLSRMSHGIMATFIRRLRADGRLPDWVGTCLQASILHNGALVIEPITDVDLPPHRTLQSCKE